MHNTEIGQIKKYIFISQEKTTVVNFQEGEFIYINKPYGISSFGALAHIRFVVSKRLGIKRVKIGHAGTLDPLATGVLVLCTGKKTKLIEELQKHTKEYLATLQFGATTDSYDREYTVNRTYPKSHITKELIEQVLPTFTGEIMQVPPIFSACNVNGKRAYELGRKGHEVVLEAKPVEIHEIELLDFDEREKVLKIRVVCGKGTYIRSLARDLGEAVGSGAFLTDLCRTKSGDVSLADCMTFDEFHEWFEHQEVEPYVQNDKGGGKRQKPHRKSASPSSNKKTETIRNNKENKKHSDIKQE